MLRLVLRTAGLSIFTLRMQTLLCRRLLRCSRFASAPVRFAATGTAFVHAWAEGERPDLAAAPQWPLSDSRGLCIAVTSFHRHRTARRRFCGVVPLRALSLRFSSRCSATGHGFLTRWFCASLPMCWHRWRSACSAAARRCQRAVELHRVHLDCAGLPWRGLSPAAGGEQTDRVLSVDVLRRRAGRRGRHRRAASVQLHLRISHPDRGGAGGACRCSPAVRGTSSARPLPG